MNKKIFVGIGVVVLAIFVAYFVIHTNTTTEPAVYESSTGSVKNIAYYVDQMPKQNLSEQEINGILYMREEEKLARDVYLTFYNEYKLPIFKNIASSEQTHMDAVNALIVKYNLNDSSTGVVGKFNNPKIQQLYYNLTARGNESLVAALEVGANIEEIDIIDLQKYISETDNQDIKFVYENLMKGSRNHLRSFVSTLAKYNVTYEPQYLNQSEYDSIISSSMERR